jgi:hypothetical protein
MQLGRVRQVRKNGGPGRPPVRRRIAVLAPLTLRCELSALLAIVVHQRQELLLPVRVHFSCPFCLVDSTLLLFSFIAL